MSFSPPGGPPKKESIFSSLAPAPAPAPAAAAAPRSAADPEAVSALKAKIDALEKNIVSQLEKKLAEQFKAAAAVTPPPAVPVPPARPSEADILCHKIEALERRLTDFGQSAALSASQLKNIEESKISARREIEDLLKAVREQQKYSELDHQMHEQLQKAWTRAEELEKKLMDFYSSVLAMEARRREDSTAAADKSAAAVEALADRMAGLEDKLATLLSHLPEEEIRRRNEEFFAKVGEERLAAQAAQAAFFEKIERENKAAREAQAEFFSRAEQERKGAREAQEIFLARSQEESLKAAREAQEEFFLKAGREREAAREMQETFFARAAEERRALLASHEAAAGEMMAGLKETSGAFREVFDNYVRSELGMFRDKVSGEVSALRRELSASAEDSRKCLREQSAMLADKTAEFGRLLEDNRLKADGVEAALATSARRQALALEEFTRSLGTELRAMNSDYAAAVKRESDERFAKFGAKYADALISVTFVEGFRSSVAKAIDRLQAHREALVSFIEAVPQKQMEKNLGVSGDMARKSFHALSLAAGDLAGEIETLRAIKMEVEGRFKDIFGPRL